MQGQPIFGGEFLELGQRQGGEFSLGQDVVVRVVISRAADY
jgi:hypothetical protein